MVFALVGDSTTTRASPALTAPLSARFRGAPFGAPFEARFADFAALGLAAPVAAVFLILGIRQSWPSEASEVQPTGVARKRTAQPISNPRRFNLLHFFHLPACLAAGEAGDLDCGVYLGAIRVPYFGVGLAIELLPFLEERTHPLHAAMALEHRTTLPGPRSLGGIHDRDVHIDNESARPCGFERSRLSCPPAPWHYNRRGFLQRCRDRLALELPEPGFTLRPDDHRHRHAEAARDLSVDVDALGAKQLRGRGADGALACGRKTDEHDVPHHSPPSPDCSDSQRVPAAAR